MAVSNINAIINKDIHKVWDALPLIDFHGLSIAR